MALGASGATATTITAVATGASYVVAGGIGLCAVGDVYEIFTDHNFVRDDFMGGNQEVYDFTKTMLYAGAACITTLAAENPDTQSKAVKKILRDKELTDTKLRTDNYVSKSTGYECAMRDFKSLKLKDIKQYDNGTIVGYLPDGRTVNLHAGRSVGGAPSLEIYDPLSESSIKIRY